MRMSIKQLQPFHIFDGLDEADAQAICTAFTTRTYEPGQDILHEGTSVQSLWIILSGECVVFRSRDPAEPYTLAELKAGDVFGEMSFIRNAPHSASIRAAATVTVGCYRREDYLRLAGERPEAAFQVATNIAAVLAERLHRMDNWVCDLMNSPDGRDHRDEWQHFRSAVYTNWDF